MWSFVKTIPGVSHAVAALASVYDKALSVVSDALRNSKSAFKSILASSMSLIDSSKAMVSTRIVAAANHSRTMLPPAVLATVDASTKTAGDWIADPATQVRASLPPYIYTPLERTLSAASEIKDSAQGVIVSQYNGAKNVVGSTYTSAATVVESKYTAAKTVVSSNYVAARDMAAALLITRYSSTISVFATRYTSLKTSSFAKLADAQNAVVGRYTAIKSYILPLVEARYTLAKTYILAQVEFVVRQFEAVRGAAFKGVDGLRSVVAANVNLALGAVGMKRKQE
jgi:hypothetical protein